MIEEFHETEAGFEEFGRGGADSHGAGIAGLIQVEFVLGEDLADHWHFKVEDQAEYRLLSGGKCDLADDREVDGGKMIIRSIAEERSLAEVDSLLPLREDNETRLIGGGDAGARFGAAIEARARD